MDRQTSGIQLHAREASNQSGALGLGSQSHGDTQPEKQSKCRGHCRIVWLVVLAFLLLLLVTVLLLLVVFGGEYNHK